MCVVKEVLMPFGYPENRYMHKQDFTWCHCSFRQLKLSLHEKEVSLLVI